MLLVLAVVFGHQAFADCVNPVTIASQASGIFSNPNTWAGQKVPTSCDNVIIKHAITLNQDYTIGGVSNSGQPRGSLLIEENGSLVGQKNLNFSGSYILINNGTLDIFTLNFWGGEPAFINTGAASISNTLAVYSGGTIQNAGTLNLRAGMQAAGLKFINKAEGFAYLTNNLVLDQSNNQGVVLENQGFMSISGTTTIHYGQVTNSGSLQMGTTLTVNSGAGNNTITNSGSLQIGTNLTLQAPTTDNSNAIISSGPFKVKGNFQSQGKFYFENIDSLVVSGSFTNGGMFVNNALDGIGQVVVKGKFTNNYNGTFTNNFGIVAVAGDFYNFARLDGDMGGFTMNQYSENAWGAIITGNIDICDSSLASGKKFMDTNNGTIDGGFQDPTFDDGTVTQCGYDLTTVQLPVSLLNWQGAYQNNQVVLKWQTATEQNSGTFAIERSLDGKTFGTIGELPAAGNSTQLLSYKFTDKNAPAGTVYYRLKETDLDGTFMYSAIIPVTTKVLSFGLTVFPNPISAPNQLTISLQGTASYLYAVEVINTYGQLLYKQTVELKSSRYDLVIPASVTSQLKDLGIIRCLNLTNGSVQTSKVVVQ
ncbi:hypothetical protein AAE02nite_30630 [Adhaeribacter aerolatus]|uniref:Secretion system C-terminal sorting domain-containing protein n=2 Tax=Adhaeribacter aerolatus TaxID=670289 RepID=A0A512B0B5_9BACT|nr:hypothetical protein AAE02nite_30630 [Adhaeribacter aerolatus]